MVKKRKLKRFREAVRDLRSLAAQDADEVFISDGQEVSVLVEGKWVKGDFDNEIRIDRNTHMRTGEKHAHIYDRKGNKLYALTHDCKPSHNSNPFRLTKTQANCLGKEGFPVPKNRIVEATLIGSGQMIIYG